MYNNNNIIIILGELPIDTDKVSLEMFLESATDHKLPPPLPPRD